MFHSNNQDCILHIGTASASSSAALPAYGSDTYTEVGMTGKIKLPKYERSVGRFNVLNDGQRRSVRGKLGDQDCSGDLVLDDDDATHNTMFSDSESDATKYRNWKVVTPTGEVHFFKGFVNLFERDEYDSSSDAKEIHVSWNIALDGKPTVA